MKRTSPLESIRRLFGQFSRTGRGEGRQKSLRSVEIVKNLYKKISESDVWINGVWRCGSDLRVVSLTR